MTVHAAKSLRSIQIPSEGRVELYVCPNCRGTLIQDRGINSAPAASGPGLYCTQCSHTFFDTNGSVDFVETCEENEVREQTHYDQRYEFDVGKFPRRPFDIDEWDRRWHDPHWPECQIILRRLGDLTDKVILCLGNGSSVKELYFAYLGAHVIHSDLSFSGVLKARAEYDMGELAGRVAFHAINAYKIPLRDSSVDIVYGFEFVHHLPDLPPFLDEVRRVLKPGGMCLFLDGAYSPIWQGAKRTALWPLMRLSHLLHRRSPEDLRATYAGGYKEEDLIALGQKRGFSGGSFERTTFFHYLCVHGIGGILGWSLPRPFYRVPGWLGRCMDALLTKRVGILARNRMELVWGFEKPGARSVLGELVDGD